MTIEPRRPSSLESAFAPSEINCANTGRNAERVEGKKAGKLEGREAGRRKPGCGVFDCGYQIADCGLKWAEHRGLSSGEWE